MDKDESSSFNFDCFLSESCAKPSWLMIHKDNVHYFDGLQEMINTNGLQPDEHGFYLLKNEFTLSLNSDEQISDFIS